LVFLPAKDLRIHSLDQRLASLEIVGKVGLKSFKLKQSRCCTLHSICNCDLFSKEPNRDIKSAQNRLQLITTLMLKWTLGLNAVVPIFNV
jgi:hypothetical protein